MDIREKLIEVKKALDMCYKQGLTSECTGCGYRGCNNVCMDALMQDAFAVINYLEEKQATSNESEWIPASEPPKDHGEYIVIIKGANRPTTLWYHPKRKTWTEGCKLDPYYVAHWMPLPEPPKED